MTISSLEQTSPDRITVHFEDGTFIKSTLSAITDLRIYSGNEIDIDTYEKLKSTSEKYLALNKAADLLSRRLMSQKEIHDKLIAKGYEELTAEYCIEKLVELGLLNDEYYADAIVRHYSAKSYGIGRIRDEFRRRGVPRDLWDNALSNIPDSSERIYKFIESHLKDSTDKKQLKKVTDSLLRRGYTWEEIKSVMRNYEL